MSSIITGYHACGPGPFPTPDPFLFCVFHNDRFPPGNARMEAPRRGNGADFNPDAPYRMYHGERIPGFPQHPHRGFETITATITGTIDHSDSQGNAGRYGGGDLQWMTAGKGVVHGEMFPLIEQEEDNPCKFFQLWINLPARSKMVDPSFKMHWAEQVPHVRSASGDTDVTVWAGSIGDVTALAPPPHSWASDPANEVAVLLIKVAPGSKYTLPAAAHGTEIARSLYWVEGDALTVGGEKVAHAKPVRIDVRADADASLSVPMAASGEALVLVLQGRPIGEPVAQHGPFVMNTQSEIAQAFADYRATRFGGWPWPSDAMVFPREKKRFSLLDGVETTPPLAPADAKSEL